jgi:hypothetical protein
MSWLPATGLLLLHRIVLLFVLCVVLTSAVLILLLCFAIPSHRHRRSSLSRIIVVVASIQVYRVRNSQRKYEL